MPVLRHDHVRHDGTVAALLVLLWVVVIVFRRHRLRLSLSIMMERLECTVDIHQPPHHAVKYTLFGD
jgi:hypothetical protein